MRKITKTITVQQPVEKEIVTGVEVELTIEEYTVLRLLLGKVAGDADNSLRAYARSLSYKLAIDPKPHFGLPRDTPHDLCWKFYNSWDLYDDLVERNVPSFCFANGSKDSELFKRLVEYYKENIK